MNIKSADLIANVTLDSTVNGGRNGPTPPDRFGCVLVIDGRNFDVRLDPESTGSVSPGQTVKIPIKFLDWDSAREHCSNGTEFLLREVHTIGRGRIEAVIE